MKIFRKNHAEDGERAFQSQQYKKAIEHFTKAIAEDPQPLFYYYRGVARDMTGDGKSAIADLSEALKLDPNHSLARYSRAVTYMSDQRVSEALADLQHAVKIAPDDFRVLNLLASILARSPEHRDPVSAISYAELANKHTSWCDPICLATLAAAHAANGDEEQAAMWQTRAQCVENEGGEFDTSFSLVEEIKTGFDSVGQGTTHQLGLKEIVPFSARAISVWNMQRKSGPTTVYTAGMSDYPLHAENGRYVFCELAMDVPSSWDIPPDLNNPAIRWPWLYMRALAYMIEQENSWCTGPVSIFAPEEQPLAAGCEFAGFLISPHNDLAPFRLSDGRTIIIMNVMPIYESELKLAQSPEGPDALLKLFVDKKIKLELAPGREKVC